MSNTGWSQPAYLKDWHEDLRRRFLEAMKKRQLELNSQVVGGSVPYGGETSLSPAQIEKRKLDLQNLQNIRDLKSEISLEETGVSDQVKTLEQQERLQSLLNQASPTTEANGALSSGHVVKTLPHLAPVFIEAQTAVKNQAEEEKKRNLERFLGDQVKETAPPPTDARHHPGALPLEGDVIAPKKVSPTKVPPKKTSEYDAYMKSLWGRYADDPEARKKMYLSQLNKIYAKSMLLDGWASITGGESRGSVYATAATDILDKTEKFDSEIRLHNIWKAAMFKDGKYYPPKTIPDFYERLQALGATASEIAELTKGVSGKSFRDQAALEATPKAYTYYDKGTREQFYAYENDERVRKGIENGTLIKLTTPTLANIEGTNFTSRMKQLGKQYKIATPTQRAEILSEAVRALESALVERTDFAFGLQQMTEEDFRTPEGKLKIVLRFMGINDPSGGRLELNQ